MQKPSERIIAEEKIEAKSDPGPASDQTTNDPRVDQALGIFGNLSALEVKPGDQVGAREILSTIGVRRPKNNEFLRVDPERSLTTVVYTDEVEGEAYFVAPHLRPIMIAGCTAKLLVLAVNQAGVPFIWPVPTDDETQRKNAWNESARAGFHRAKIDWVKLVGDRVAGQYRIFLAEGELPAPRFPDKPFSELLAIAFNNRLIDNEGHHVIKAMRGLTV
jgi:hypothetical protein